MKNTEIVLYNPKAGDIITFPNSKLPYVIAIVDKKGNITAFRERVIYNIATSQAYERDAIYLPNNSTEYQITVKNKYTEHDIKELLKFANKKY